MIDVYLREPEPARLDDYRYVAQCAPGALRSFVAIEGGSDRDPHEALDRLRAGLKELNLASSDADLNVHDDAGLLEDESETAPR